MNMNMRMCAAMVLAVGLSLSGCGGGGGEGGGAAFGPAKVPLAVANYDGIAQEVADSVAGSDDIFSALDLATAASVGPASVAQLATGQPDALARFALAQVTRSAAGRAKAAAVDTSTEVCTYGGSLTVVANIANRDGSPSAGDVITATANGCVVISGEPAVNGVFSIRIRSIVLDTQGAMTSGTLVMGFDAFGADGVVLNGSAVLSVSADRLVLDFDGLSASDGAQTRVYDFAVTAQSGVVSVAGPITVNGSTYVLATPTVLQSGAGHPVAGTLRITDGHGNRVDVVMASTTYTASLYLTGDEVVDASATHPW